MFQLLKHCNRKEFTPIICTRKDGPFWEKFEQLNVPVHPFILRKLSLTSFIALYRFLKIQQPNLIHTHGKGPGLYGRIIGKILGIPTVHTFHGFHYQDIPLFKRNIHLFIENFLSRITKHHIFVGEAEKERAGIISGLKEKNTVVIRNGVDATLFQSLTADRNILLHKLQLERFMGKKILGLISRFSPEKGILQLLERYTEIREKYPEWKLIIIGDAPEEHIGYKSKATNIIKKNNLGEDIALVGFREDAKQFLKCFDIYVSPSLSEGLPLALLEAFSAELPVIASDIPGNCEVLGTPPCGIMFSPETPQALSKAMDAFIKLDENEKINLTNKAYKRVIEEFSSSKMAEKTWSLYKKILD